MYAVHLYKRLTHKFVDTFRHLDQDEYVCTVKLTPPKKIEEGNGLDDMGTYVQFARIPAGASRKNKKDVLQALRDTLSYSGCHHEYDCCGCSSQYAILKLVGPRDVHIMTRRGRNY